jgi:hypothetical protein
LRRLGQRQLEGGFDEARLPGVEVLHDGGHLRPFSARVEIDVDPVREDGEA